LLSGSPFSPLTSLYSPAALLPAYRPQPNARFARGVTASPTHPGELALRVVVTEFCLISVILTDCSTDWVTDRLTPYSTSGSTDHCLTVGSKGLTSACDDFDGLAIVNIGRRPVSYPNDLRTCKPCFPMGCARVNHDGPGRRAMCTAYRFYTSYPCVYSLRLDSSTDSFRYVPFLSTTVFSSTFPS
jgi:hypothetical protein